MRVCQRMTFTCAIFSSSRVRADARRAEVHRREILVEVGEASLPRRPDLHHRVGAALERALARRDGGVLTEGDQVSIEKSVYVSLCRRHWEEETGRWPPP